MNKAIVAVLITISVTLLCSCTSTTFELPPNNTVEDEASKKFSDYIDNIQGALSRDLTERAQVFNVKLLKQIYNSDKNLFYSSVSINTAFTGIYFAAANKTQDEIRQTLILGDVSDDVIIANQIALMDSYKNTGDSITNIANSIWLDDDFSVKSGYIDGMKSMLDMDVATLDMNSGRAEGILNAWISDKTNQMIPSFYKEGDLRDNVFVLLNAIYFDGEWTHPFEEHRTFKREFNGSNNIQKVDFMHQNHDFLACENDEYKSIVLPYGKDERFKMTIVLPKDNIQGFINDLSDKKLNHVLATFDEYEGVFLGMPKFSMEETINLKEILNNMGMNLAFDSLSADFSNLTNQDVFIQRARHKAKITVDELGTEAAAVTEVAMQEAAAVEPQKPFEFIADRPFLFFVTDSQTDLVLFTGAVNKID